ncbi:permease prefix domain 1-containing protein [Actinomadura terrae]|uniref:permease prefix domain 1-containing protein n=1 Tax=Actinomadura terrae TaxID=604353 RepID=UPI001FA70481|nr:permease prefix domain 1-containing protein [Actinomadura terrae]
MTAPRHMTHSTQPPGAHEADPDETSDPIEDYTATLTATLRGPSRLKSRMIEEIRDGLTDTAAAYTGEGVPYPDAVHSAIQEFGTADELAPNCQRELTLAQARHTGRVAALTVPFLATCWFLTWTSGPDGGWPLRLLAVHLGCVATAAALLATVALTATGPLARRLPTPRRLPLAVAWTGTAAGVAMGIGALALLTAAAPAANWPMMAVAGGLTAVSHAGVTSAARACRHCARA